MGPSGPHRHQLQCAPSARQAARLRLRRYATLCRPTTVVPMSGRVIAGLSSICVAATGLVAANILLTAMIGEINRKRSDENLVSYLGFTFPKVQRVVEEYRRSYPAGRLHIYTSIAFVLAIAALVAAGMALRIIG
jgi:hypothetical protein